MSKTPGSAVISGALKGEPALTIRAARRAVDSRYAQIMRVMRQSEEQRPRLRRLGDTLGAYYTPLALVIAIAAAFFSGEARRFLAVIVTATPCPLLIAIPVAIIGAISLAARRGIIVREPAVLEQVDQCSTIIFDKTGPLTYGRPRITEQLVAEGFAADEVLGLVASVERYSKHPLAQAILDRAEEAGIPLRDASHISEKPGQGLTATVAGREVRITSRNKLAAVQPELAAGLPPLAAGLPPLAGGLECVVLIDGQYAATYRFRDEVRTDGRPFIDHLHSRHAVGQVMILSGDRESEVRHLAEQVGIHDVRGELSPEDKLAIVRAERRKAPTLFVGDGINDAPALAAATVGLAFGTGSDITSEAAGAVVLDTSLRKVDEFLHIGRRMRRIALQSALGGMAASLIAMGFAAAGFLPPVGGAIVQEIIDVLTVLNAVRVAIPPAKLSDY
jgi:heavy metal translocating P-type ATPase